MEQKDLELFESEQGRIKLMEKYGNSQTAFTGRNVENELVIVSINFDNITVVTYQSNKWIREDFYNEQGQYECESYKGRWK